MKISKYLNKESALKYWQWLDDHLLLILAGFLLAFIPLYPKLPLFELIPGYIVRVRIEDFLVLLTVGVWGVQLWRGKAVWRTPLTWLIIGYAVIGALSTLSAMFITQTVPLQPFHVGKTFLHYLRYLQYFSLFFVLVSSVKNKQHIKILATVIVVTVLGISLYGIGQKYYYWPVYSTMNREFSKGIRLYLTEHARVQSTFGGHYDLAAYMVVFLPLIFALATYVKKRWVWLGLWAVFTFGVWIIMVSSSRISFLAFFVAIACALTLLSLNYNKWSKRIIFFLQNGLIVCLISLSMTIGFGEDVYERMLQSLEAYPEINRIYHNANHQRKVIFFDILPSYTGLDRLQYFNRQKPNNAISTKEAEVLVKSDTRPSTGRPSDVYLDIPDIKTILEYDADGNLISSEIEVDRVFSENALRYGLSLAIRLDTLWPRALEGFYRNPFLGSGYATLTKDSIDHFTEAESTDNNFLRTLGETGLLGFLTFYGAVLTTCLVAIKIARTSNSKSQFEKVLAISFLAASIGLLINAIYIDVFAASKVAFMYWSFAGIVVASYLYLGKLDPPLSKNDKSKTIKNIKNKSKKIKSKSSL